MIYAKNFARNHKKKKVLGPSDAWSMSHSSQQPSVLYWRLSDLCSYLLCNMVSYLSEKYIKNRRTCLFKGGLISESVLVILAQISKESYQITILSNIHLYKEKMARIVIWQLCLEIWAKVENFLMLIHL